MSDILDYFDEGFAKSLDVPDHWLPAIYQLHEFLKSRELTNYKIQQVKQKFSSLRFYCSWDHDDETSVENRFIEDAISYVECICDYNMESK